MTSEYSPGMIRSTLAAAPQRPVLLAAKAAVFGALALVVGEVAAFASRSSGGGKRQTCPRIRPGRLAVLSAMATGSLPSAEWVAAVA